MMKTNSGAAVAAIHENSYGNAEDGKNPRNGCPPVDPVENVGAHLLRLQCARSNA